MLSSGFVYFVPGMFSVFTYVAILKYPAQDSVCLCSSRKNMVHSIIWVTSIQKYIDPSVLIF